MCRHICLHIQNRRRIKGFLDKSIFRLIEKVHNIVDHKLVNFLVHYVVNQKMLKKIISCAVVSCVFFGCAQKEEVSMQKSQKLEDWKKTICYEIYPSSFQDSDGDGVGDLKGITQRLDYLESLNVGCIWLTPVYASPMRDNGYDVSDFYQINPLYGTMADMDELLQQAKKHHIQVMMDLVFNHVSNESAWFLESKKNRTNPKSDWFIWKDPKPDGSAPNNWRGIFGGSAWTFSEERRQYYLHTFADFQPDLNWENPEVRQALYDIANFWIQKGVGAFRMDAIVYIKKPTDFRNGVPDAADGLTLIHTMTANSAGILDFLHEMKREVFDGKNVFTVAEANGILPEDLKFWVGDSGVFDMLFEFEHLQGSDIWFSTKTRSTKEIKQAIFKSEKETAKNGWYPVFFENHDKPRSVNAYFPETADKTLAAKAILTLLFTLRGTPFLYQGEELGMENVTWNSIDCFKELNSKSQYAMALKEGFLPQEALRFVQKYSRDNARTPMQWNAEKNAGFSSGKSWIPVHENYKQINVATENVNENSVLAWTKKLLDFRKNSEILLQGNWEPILENDENIFAYKRTFGGKSIFVFVNFSEKEIALEENFMQKAKQIFSSYGDEKKNAIRPFESKIFAD